VKKVTRDPLPWPFADFASGQTEARSSRDRATGETRVIREKPPPVRARRRFAGDMTRLAPPAFSGRAAGLRASPAEPSSAAPGATVSIEVEDSRSSPLPVSRISQAKAVENGLERLRAGLPQRREAHSTGLEPVTF
jgi:hypothetical protein